MGQAKAGNGAGNGGGKRAEVGLVTLGEGMAVIGLGVAFDLEHPRVRGQGRPAVGVDRDEPVVRSKPDRDVAVAADAAGGRLHDERDEGRGGQRVDGVAALPDRLDAGLRRERMAAAADAAFGLDRRVGEERLAGDHGLRFPLTEISTARLPR